jgi:CRP-like cAMP-binding protein
LIGNEGAVGIPQFLGSGATPSHAVVLSAGKCLRVDTQSLKEEVNRMGPVMNVLLRYTQALMTQLAQTAVCNRHHSINQQFCRWLLLSLDRVNGSTLKMTHDQFSDLLGVRREGITMAASKLQSDGLIKYARGHITVLDREGIEDLACECYSVVNKEYDRLVPKFLAG